jgi:flagellar motor switch protein FliM
MTQPSTQPVTRRHRVREVDFRRPSKFSREQVRRLEHAHDGFCQSAVSRMSAELRSELQLAVLGTDQLPYGTVMSDEVSRHSFVSVLRIDQLATELALVMDMPLAQSLVQRLLGGSGHTPGNAAPTPSQATSLTAVEVAVARRAVASLVESLSSTWLDLAQVSLSMAGTSTNPTSVQLVPSSEPTLVLNISAAIDGTASVITLIMPHRSVEPIMHHFEQGAMYGPAAEDDSRNRALMRAAVGEVDVELRAEAGAVRLPIADVLGLAAGDTVRLRRPVEKGVTLFVGDVETYAASPGRNGNQRAVQVRAPMGRGSRG